MATSLINHPGAKNFKYRFRMYCLTDAKRGKWRDDEDDAKKDVEDHKKSNGNESHEVVIEIEQKYVVVMT